MLTNNYYQDAGCSLNENVVDFLTLPTLKNVYNLNDSNLKAKGSAILTDAPSSTWCRAPGTTEGTTKSNYSENDIIIFIIK